MSWTIILTLVALAATITFILWALCAAAGESDRRTGDIYQNHINDMVTRINRSNIELLRGDGPLVIKSRGWYVCTEANRIVTVIETNGIEAWKNRKTEAEADAWVQTLIDNSETPVY